VRRVASNEIRVDAGVAVHLDYALIKVAWLQHQRVCVCVALVALLSVRLTWMQSGC